MSSSGWLITKQNDLNKTIEIPVTVSGNNNGGIDVKEIDVNAFSECQWINKIIFNDQLVSLKISPESFNGLNPKETYYYAKENSGVIDGLTSVNIDDNHIIFKGDKPENEKFEFSKSHLIHSVNANAFPSESIAVKIPRKPDSNNYVITGIDTHAFKEFEGLGKLSSIAFEPNKDLTNISLEAFSGLDLFKTKFYVNGIATSIVDGLRKILEHEGGNVSQVIVRDENFEISANQQLLKFTSNEKHITITSNYGGINVAGIGQNAFVDADLESISFPVAFV